MKTYSEPEKNQTGKEVRNGKKKLSRSLEITVRTVNRVDQCSRKIGINYCF